MKMRKIDCPTCGNEITAKETTEEQKCKWCRQLYKVTLGKRNWQAEHVDFPERLYGFGYEDNETKGRHNGQKYNTGKNSKKAN